MFPWQPPASLSRGTYLHSMNDENVERESGMSGSPSERLVLEIADRAGVEPTALPPLYETVDPEALNTVLRKESCRVSFEYAAHEVTVNGSGHVTIDKIDRHEFENDSDGATDRDDDRA